MNSISRSWHSILVLWKNESIYNALSYQGDFTKVPFTLIPKHLFDQSMSHRTLRLNFYSWGDFPKVPASYFLQESAFHSHWITFVLSSRTFKKTIAIHCTAGDNFEPLPNPVTLCSWNINNSQLKTYKFCFCYYAPPWVIDICYLRDFPQDL